MGRGQAPGISKGGEPDRSRRGVFFGDEGGRRGIGTLDEDKDDRLLHLDSSRV